MESLPLLRRRTRKAAAAAADKPPLRFACIYFSNGVEPDALVGEGRGASMEFGPAAAAAHAHPRGPGLRQGSLQPARPSSIHQPAHGPHGEHALRRAGEPRPQRHSRRHHHGPGAGQADRRPDPRAEHGARHRAQRAAARRRPLDDLRLEHLVGHRRPSPPPRRSIPRAPSTSWWATARAASSTAASSMRCWRTPTACSRRSAAATARSSTNIWNRCATSRSASTALARRSASKAGGRRCNSPTCRVPPTRFRRTCRTT